MKPLMATLLTISALVPLSAFSQVEKEIILYNNKHGLAKIRGCTLETVSQHDDAITINRTSLNGIQCKIYDEKLISCPRIIERPNTVYQQSTCRPGVAKNRCETDDGRGRDEIMMPDITGPARLSVVNAINSYATSYCSNAAIHDYTERSIRFNQRIDQRWAAEEARLTQLKQGQNRIRSREGDNVLGTCASGRDFSAFQGSDGRWTTGGGRNGMQFASNLDEAVRKVCN